MKIIKATPIIALVVVMDSHTVHVVFEPITYMLDVSFTGMGTVEPSGEHEYSEMEEVVVSITPLDDHWTIKSLHVNGIHYDSVDELVLTMDEDKNVDVVFECESRYLEVTSEGNGTLSHSGILYYDDCSEIPDITAISDSGYKVGNFIVNDEYGYGSVLSYQEVKDHFYENLGTVHVVFVEENESYDPVELIITPNTDYYAGESYFCDYFHFDLIYEDGSHMEPIERVWGIFSSFSFNPTEAESMR